MLLISYNPNPLGIEWYKKIIKAYFLFNPLLQVTSDIHKYFILFFHITHMSFYFGFLVKTIFGLLPFWLIFFLVEVLKISLHLAVAVFNFSIIIQISYILNFEWVTRFDDKVSIYISYSYVKLVFIVLCKSFHIFKGSNNKGLNYFKGLDISLYLSLKKEFKNMIL